MLSQPQKPGAYSGDNGQPSGFLGSAAVRVPGSCGELVQGLGAVAHVSGVLGREEVAVCGVLHGETEVEAWGR